MNSSENTVERLVVIGVSAGGLKALKALLQNLSKNYHFPTLINQHLPQDRTSNLATILQTWTHLQVKEADDKELILNNSVYVAPPNYHLLVERDHTLSLSADDPENYARPSADVMFESAAEVFQDKAIGIILTGASDDGARGLLRIKERGGLIMVQSLEEAEFKTMPSSAITLTKTKNILRLDEIAKALSRIGINE